MLIKRMLLTNTFIYYFSLDRCLRKLEIETIIFKEIKNNERLIIDGFNLFYGGVECICMGNTLTSKLI